MKPRSAGYVRRWASKVMHHFVRSHVLSSMPSRLPAVVRVSVHRVVPAVALAMRALVARVLCFRLAPVGPFVTPAFVPALPPQASAVPGANGYAGVLGRPLSLGRAGRSPCVRRVSSSARRGRRLTSADSHLTGVACNGSGYVSRFPRCTVRAGACALPWRPVCATQRPNPPVDPVPFGHWTLRDKAAQRRSPSTLKKGKRKEGKGKGKERKGKREGEKRGEKRGGRGRRRREGKGGKEREGKEKRRKRERGGREGAKQCAFHLPRPLSLRCFSKVWPGPQSKPVATSLANGRTLVLPEFVPQRN